MWWVRATFKDHRHRHHYNRTSRWHGLARHGPGSSPRTRPEADRSTRRPAAALATRPIAEPSGYTAAEDPAKDLANAFTRCLALLSRKSSCPRNGITAGSARRVADAAAHGRGPYVQMPTPGLTPSAVPRIPGCPAGLEYLAQVDHLLVHQRLELMEMLVPFETKNKYVVKNTMGQFVFMAIEDSDLLSRCFCGSIRPFQMSLLDYRSVEVLRLFRPLRCDCCLCFCCLQACIYRPTYL
ncbi:hypothetical protein HPB49_018904 [Dermacentor silvarum]|uniref:Uncharacterized protein n=1 Tax=Dermacentor silvarum TaxID=543639 RepID=A0ACB8DL10_DERSI|nr:hypothetical protein HPB49_018904 [Dermacentor silvarum]